ncbi:hypothetical protein [Ensifer aridi]|uniref:hypothetical protein n=1 Tax=Ensifer aridi TaxID=1708715 RepID=UPI000A11A788|nr:hypothetical protein [Ensifer aridi]
MTGDAQKKTVIVTWLSKTPDWRMFKTQFEGMSPKEVGPEIGQLVGTLNRDLAKFSMRDGCWAVPTRRAGEVVQRLQSVGYDVKQIGDRVVQWDWDNSQIDLPPPLPR